MTFVNGMVASVQDAKKDIFIGMAKAMKPIFQRHGALDVVDCWGVDVPEGKVTSFPMAVQCEPGETVVFSWIEWPDKETADTGMQAAMSDPEMEPHLASIPFDGKRMIFGGFEKI